jgi:hypothetical protein
LPHDHLADDGGQRDETAHEQREQDPDGDERDTEATATHGLRHDNPGATLERSAS